MSMSHLVRSLDQIFRIMSCRGADVNVGHNTRLSWRKVKGIRGNRLHVGHDSIVHAKINFEDTGASIEIGNRVFIGASHFACYRKLKIGDDVIMSWGVTVVDHDSHSLDWTKRGSDVIDWFSGKKNWANVPYGPVAIGDKTWIGFNVSILKGVTIGEGAVIGACSVVTRDVPAYSLAVGNPARVIRSLVAIEDPR